MDSPRNAGNTNAHSPMRHILINRRVWKCVVWLSHMDDWHTHILRACKFGVMSTVGFVMRSGAFLCVPSGSMALADQDECQTKTARAAQYPRHADSSIVHFPPTTTPPSRTHRHTHAVHAKQKHRIPKHLHRFKTSYMRKCRSLGQLLAFCELRSQRSISTASLLSIAETAEPFVLSLTIVLRFNSSQR